MWPIFLAIQTNIRVKLILIRIMTIDFDNFKTEEGGGTHSNFLETPAIPLTFKGVLSLVIRILGVLKVEKSTKLIILVPNW